LKIFIIVGTRPEYIKLAPVYLELKKNSKNSIRWIQTNQHNKKTLQDLSEFWNIDADHIFNIKNQKLSLPRLAAKLLKEADLLFKEERPDLVIVQGDTISAAKVAETAFYNKIKIAHIEAGFRTNSIYSPFPEEFLRRSISEIADFHFCPSKETYEQLLKELNSKKINQEKKKNISLTGNTGIDALLESIKRLCKTERQYKKHSRPFILVSSHRRENLSNGYQEALCRGIYRILSEEAYKHLDLDFIICLHNNPDMNHNFFELKKNLNEDLKRQSKGKLKKHSRLKLLKTVPYPDFIELMQDCLFIITDSGGIQEEAPYLGKKVLVLREESERKELLLANKFLQGTVKQAMKNGIFDSGLSGKEEPPYGNGSAARKIVGVLELNSKKHN